MSCQGDASLGPSVRPSISARLYFQSWFSLWVPAGPRAPPRIIVNRHVQAAVASPKHTMWWSSPVSVSVVFPSTLLFLTLHSVAQWLDAWAVSARCCGSQTGYVHISILAGHSAYQQISKISLLPGRVLYRLAWQLFLPCSYGARLTEAAFHLRLLTEHTACALLEGGCVQLSERDQS